MLFHRCHSFECFGMSEYCNRKGGWLSLSKQTRSCGFRHFSVLAGGHAILPLERCVELAHALISPQTARSAGWASGWCRSAPVLAAGAAGSNMCGWVRRRRGETPSFKKVGETENCLQSRSMVSFSDRCAWMYALISNRLWDTGQPVPEGAPSASSASVQSKYNSSTDLKTQ